ncbi:pseudouridine-metabolizing bifunctional protein C1861.05-like [Ornithorhynchus anatinus]|uniref:Carbohydrate kinase PfkB domain-containing protein n=1 Tax=Ornithorhynchus anatinus TaxID=9258 RepID=A0A6I8P945_ORNAN|nr:pseudouridine-metabolizing bifunctional protein C1861.05-like [Ornithorhynchus anatinus]
MIGTPARVLGSCRATLAQATTSTRSLLRGFHMQVHPTVREALTLGKPVVALESAIVTHGMPYPRNLSMARAVEEIVKTHGAVPATVGVLDGRIHVGLSHPELRSLAERKGTFKVSRRDLPYVLSQGLSGGTTVSATMIVAKKAGISVFVTGGIGGVHREGEKTLDVSADLTELGRTPVAVVSSGVKSILDIGRTLEYLETQGVCVATFGESRDFPAFFCPHSGFQAPYHVPNEKEAAKLIAGALELGLGSGLLIAVPVPPDQAASAQEIEAAIQQALGEARVNGIVGKELTPFVLQRVNELSGGKSLESNMALIQNNASVGSRIAVALSQLRMAPGGGNDGGGRRARGEAVLPAQPVVVGGTNIDFIAKTKSGTLQAGGQTLPGKVIQAFGGVGCNLADCLSRLGWSPLFISALGKDALSRSVLRYCSHMDMGGVAQLEGHSTATYCAVVSGNGKLTLGLGDMDVHEQITEQWVSTFEDRLCRAPLLCFDGNLPLATIRYLCDLARDHRIPLCFEPTDENKASKPFLSDSWTALTYASPNLRELRAIARALGHPGPAELPRELDAVLSVAGDLARPLLQNLRCVVVTLGEHGVLLCGRQGSPPTVSLAPAPRGPRAPEGLFATHFPAPPVPAAEIVNELGAGDSFLAGMLAGLLSGLGTGPCVGMGMLAAGFSLRSPWPVSPRVSTATVNLERTRSGRWPEPRTWRID